MFIFLLNIFPSPIFESSATSSSWCYWLNIIHIPPTFYSLCCYLLSPLLHFLHVTESSGFLTSFPASRLAYSPISSTFLAGALLFDVFKIIKLVHAFRCFNKWYKARIYKEYELSSLKCKFDHFATPLLKTFRLPS